MTSNRFGRRATCPSSPIWASTRWRWAPCWPISTRTRTRCCRLWRAGSASGRPTTGPSSRQPAEAKGDKPVAYFAAALARTDGKWSSQELELGDVEDLDGLVEEMRRGVDDTALVLLFVEEDDEWFGIVRLDEDADPRAFLSDGRVVETSTVGTLLAEAATVTE